MHKILIISALSDELKTIKKEIQKYKIPNLKISYFSSGVGNYNMILNLTRFLENTSFDFVVNIGVCGYKEEKVDFFEVSRIFNLANKKEVLVPILLNFGELESLACSEKVVYNSEKIGEENFVDMESYGFEKVMDSFSIPRAIFKIPVDKIGEETKNFDFKKAEKYLSEHIDYKKLLEKISNYLEKNQKKNSNFELYFSFYNFTFSEKEIFKKLYFRYISLVSQDFGDYFEKYKSENKKDFLKNLENFLEQYLIK